MLKELAKDPAFMSHLFKDLDIIDEIDSLKATSRDIGREEGIEEGREESMRAVVKKLKAKGLETADIAENLDLSIEKVNGYLRAGSASKAKKP